MYSFIFFCVDLHNTNGCMVCSAILQSMDVHLLAVFGRRTNILVVPMRRIGSRSTKAKLGSRCVIWHPRTIAIFFDITLKDKLLSTVTVSDVISLMSPVHPKMLMIYLPFFQNMLFLPTINKNKTKKVEKTQNVHKIYYYKKESEKVPGCSVSIQNML